MNFRIQPSQSKTKQIKKNTIRFYFKNSNSICRDLCYALFFLFPSKKTTAKLDRNKKLEKYFHWQRFNDNAHADFCLRLSDTWKDFRWKILVLRSSCWDLCGLGLDFSHNLVFNSKSLGHTKSTKYFANILTIEYYFVITRNAFLKFRQSYSHHILCIATTIITLPYQIWMRHRRKKVRGVWIVFQTLIDQSI